MPGTEAPDENHTARLISSDGAYPEAGVILDAAGNLYGTTESQRPNGLGVIYELTP